jgi:O-antigen ligase
MQQIDTRLSVEKTRPLILPKKVVYICVRLRTSPSIVRWTFLLFVFIIPFEAIDLGAVRGASSLSRIAGLLFFSTCLFYPKICFRRPQQAVWWFVAYAFGFGMSGFLIQEQVVGPFLGQLQTLIQLLILCWVGSTLLQEEKFARYTLLTFAIATLLLALGMLLGVPGFSRVLQGGKRLSVAGYDPNGLAVIMAMGAQAFIGFGIDPNLRNIWMRVIYMAMSLVPLTALVYTGSRGGIMAYMTGVALYAVPYRGSKRKMAAILGATIAVGGVLYIAVNNQNFMSRFESTLVTGDTAGRGQLFRASIEMIAEKPLLGWGPDVFGRELARREGSGHQARAAHNLLLHVLLEGGLLGAGPFLIGLALCVRAAWAARVHSLGLLSLVWLSTMLVSSMTITTIRNKSLWFVLMLSLASAASIVKQFKRKDLVRRILLDHSKNG